MKIKNNIFKTIISAATFLLMFSCELEPEVYDKISPENFPKTEEDLTSAVTGIYYEFREGWAPRYLNRSHLMLNILTTDELTTAWGHDWQSNNEFLFLENSIQIKENYTKYVKAITKATLLLESFDDVGIENEELVERFTAEVRALRAWFAFNLLDLFGPVPIITDPELVSDIKKLPELERPERKSMVDFIESELLWCSERLPAIAYENEQDYGRITAGASLTILLKLYMLEKNWAKAEAISSQIMGMRYELNPDYVALFDIANENYSNKELILTVSLLADPIALGTTWFACVMPQVPLMKTDVKMSVWGGLKVPWAFYDKFDSIDTRRTNMVRYYVSDDGDTVDFREATHYKAVGANPLKYSFDPNHNGNTSGNDHIILRYADVLLCRAEALNELNGPTQEAIDLINQIRGRANVPDINLTDYDKSSLRDFILEERGRELWCEGVRRQDLLRHGKYISTAIAEGYAVEDKHKLFPIPQDAREENPLLGQNPGWN
jgi:hypothetical protein